MFTQKNGLVVKEGKIYRSHVGDLVKVIQIDMEKLSMKCFNISEAANAWHRIDSAIKDNKFKEEVS
jgi:hypothetical protein